MSSSLKVKLWGVRGSLPSPLSPQRLRQNLSEVLGLYEKMRAAGKLVDVDDFLGTLPAHLAGGYGGHTLCCEVRSPSSRLIIDGGSGLRPFAETVLQNEPQTKEFHFYMTHFHWDHLIGFPFFIPIYRKDCTVHFYGVHEDLEPRIRALFCKPNFPVPFEALGAKIHFHRLQPRQMFKIGDLECTPYLLDHPDPSWGIRVSHGGKNFAHCVDTECTRVSREQLGEDLPLYQNLDLMIFDAQYTFGESVEKINWGHSSGPIGLDLAFRENIKRILFLHHDPSSSDETIRQAELQTLLYYEQQMKLSQRQGRPHPPIDWQFAVEGTEVDL